jgi:phytoene synthase
MSDLAASYGHCRALHRAHGRTYYLATRLLPAWKRRHVHALYGFTRHTDDIVDGGGTAEGRAAALAAWTARFEDCLRGGSDGAGDPILPAVLHTISLFDVDRADLAAFLRSMAMDLTVTGYPDYDALLDYMEGSAAVIGTMMLPILLAPDRGPGGGAPPPGSRPASWAWRSS